MENNQLNYRLVKEIKDEKFDVENLHHYSLSLQLSEDDFQICITDSKNNNCLILEDYILNDLSTIDSLIGTLANLFDGHHLLQAGFWNSVKFSFKDLKFTLIPENLFDKDHLEDYLKLNSDFDKNEEEIHYYKQIKSDIVVVFAINKKLLSWLKSVYPNSQFHILHQGCALIEGTLNYEDHANGKSMFLFLDREAVSVLVTNNRQLELYNKFPYGTTSEFFKYVASVFQQSGLDQNHSKVIIWGNINKNAPQFKELYNYVKHVSFGGKPSYLNFNFVFDELEDHQYFDLYSTFLCE